MTVKELKAELAFYEDNKLVRFEVNDDIMPESITNNVNGWCSVRIDNELIPDFIGHDIEGNCLIEFRVDDK